MKKWIVVLGLFWSSQASALEVTGHGGWLHTSNSNYQDSWTGDIRLEGEVYKDFSLGIEGGYHGKQFHEPSYGNVSGYSLIGEVIYNVPLDWRFKPYVLGGIGWSWWNFDRSQDMIDKGIAINLGNSFAEKFGIGADYAIGGNWSINLEWDYFVTHIPKDSHYESDGSFSNVVGGKTVGQEETNFVIGLKYKF